MRTPKKETVKKIIKLIKDEQPDYIYIRDLFQKVRRELDIEIKKETKQLPYVPTEETIKKYYDVISAEQNMQHVILIRIFLYTGVRVSELVAIKLDDINFTDCQITIRNGKGNKGRVVPFPKSFKETLLIFVQHKKEKKATYLFESIRKKQFTTRGINKILEKYTRLAGMEKPISPHKLRHFLFTWMKKKGIDDALIQPFSGHDSRKSLEIYSRLSLNQVQNTYDQAIKEFPI